MNYLVNVLRDINEYNDILDAITKYTRPVNITGPSDSQKVHIACAICEHTGRKGVFITYNEMQARRAYEDFSFFLGDDVLLYPSREIVMYDIEAKNYDDVYERVKVIDRLINGDYKFLVTSAEAISHKLVPKEMFIDNTLEFAVGSRINLSETLQKFVAMGYERTDTVEAKGQFAVRGGIIDIFPANSEQAVRIELFDDEVDSIRSFDTLTQRSVDRVEKVRVIPARDVIYPADKVDTIIGRIEEDLLNQGNYSPDSPLCQKIKSDIDRIKNDYYFPGIDRYIPYIIDEPGIVTDFVDDSAVVFVDEFTRLKQRNENLLLEHGEICKTMMEKGKILPGSLNIFFDFVDICKRFKNYRTVYLNSLAAEKEISGAKCYNIASRSIGSYNTYIDILVEEIRDWKTRGSRIVILSGTKGRGERLVETLRASNVEAVYNEDRSYPIMPGQVVITRGSLYKGFEYPSIGLVVLSGREVFGQDRVRKRAKSRKKGDRINLFTDLKPGDYVVHQTHGIGQYVGMEKLTVENIKRDYLKIRYQDGAFLYIPTNQLDLIQKYIGSEGKTPKLSKLGGSDWVKTKKKVKESLKELAAELIKLYAQRQALKGFAYSKDTVWQRQFEEQFPYEETEDQLKCIEEIKRDMESDKVMDRLLCGDVGYGKTEVAIRAVFKAVMDGKQVAYLVPTTILAQQHYNTFKERMKDFPVVVDVISRFRTRSEQKKILKDVKSGNIDVLIGTHRLLQKDIQFKDLGLLVIDEEQRFGVAHKEKIKNLKPNVDVLTLTATPIPRTLHMSLVGIRDISVIEDPPEERYPVQTYVMEYDEDVIKDAIIRELGRKGQVFYLYNRVRSIDVKASHVQRLVPDARVAVAHGQMDERQLEDIMLAYISGEYDILVCTTIIESGLDMPNVNTIIIEDADRMGLAQLYQLRGRVGRSNRLAYAYITYRKDKVVSEMAEKRLLAIKEFTELGSGFKIAMRDMEIRGAGNLLGPEQHGHMESVGYDMYCRLLDEAIRELKGGGPVQEEPEVTVDINVNAYIDNEYISSENQRIEMYKKIASIQDEQDVLDVEDELMDRYGELPQPVRNLISIAYIKSLAAKIGFSSITEKNGSVLFQLSSVKKPDIKVIFDLAARYKRQLLFNAGNDPHLVYRISGVERDKLLDNIKILLHDIKSFEV
ncbi:MAG TPA: transcription-repair coupling factor [Clostridiaceae bacterium]|nr:transcription-repair coupling factor [Clostridiaceae bacterium]